MRVLRSQTTVLKGVSGKLLRVREDNYVEIDPDAFMVQIAVEAGQVFTLPTPNVSAMTTPYIDLYMELYDSYQGNLLQSDDNTAGNSQPRIVRSLAANTEYYIKVTGKTASISGWFNIMVNGTAATPPTDHAGVTSLILSVVKPTMKLDRGGELWFKFRTNTATNYTIQTYQATLAGFPGYNYSVDWGDGTTTTTNITTYNSADRIHTYANKGSYVISIRGVMPGWTVDDNTAIKLLITRGISWGNVGLKVVNFYGCTALTNLPDGIGNLVDADTGKLTEVIHFANFCRGCTSLVYIPYGIFFGNDIAYSFSYAFYNNTALSSIPQSTFRDTIDAQSFTYTFSFCTKLLTLPTQLFINCYKVNDWSHCFEKTTGLTSIPAGLFYRILQETDYSSIYQSNMSYCFYGCSALLTIPIGLFSSPQVDNLGLNPVKGTTFLACFASCSVLNNLPTYIFHNQIYCISLQGIFSNCSSLTRVPDYCCEGCTAATSAGGIIYYSAMSHYLYGFATGCAALTTIGQYCFKDCTSITDFSYVFYANANLTTVEYGCFANCIAATTFASAFMSDTKLDTLPLDLFRDCPNVTSFYRTFYNCNLGYEPGGTGYQLDEDIFRYNTEATVFEATFYWNQRLKGLPSGLFKYNTVANTFLQTFQNCTNLAVLPSLLFRYNTVAVNFNSTFNGCTALKKIPEIYENGEYYGFFNFNPLATTFLQTFYNCRLENDMNGAEVLVWAIPEKTFWGNAEVQGSSRSNTSLSSSFYQTFGSNITLQGVPDNLFKYNIKATDFGNLFNGCTNVNFTTIPPYLFWYNTNASNFDGTFANVPITSIPEDLFRKCIRASTFASCFVGAKITSIPERLFGSDDPLLEDKGPGGAVQSFNATFQYNTLLTVIPANLFKYNINAIDFASCFYGDTLLTTIPQDLFRYNVIASSFNSTFYNCGKLSNINTGIFKYNLGVTNFYRTFYNCTDLILESKIFYDISENQYIKTTRFANKSMDFRECFYRTTLQRTLDLFAEVCLTYNGTVVISDDNSGANWMPLINVNGLGNNVDRYIKVTTVSGSSYGKYSIVVTGGNGTGVAVDEPGVTTLIKGTTLSGETISPGQTKWYKFATTTNTTNYTYTITITFDPTEETGATSTAPDIWTCTYNYTPQTTNCFGGAGNNVATISNFSSIPTSWKT